MFIPILFVLAIILKKLKKGNINGIVSIISLLVCESYMFLKIDFTSIESIIVGLIMGIIQSFILTAGSMYCLYGFGNDE